MKLIPFAEFPAHERDALHAVLARVRMPCQQVCITRMEPVAGVDDPALPRVALVSAPGFSRTYEGEDWIRQVEADLAALLPRSVRHAENSPSHPVPLGSA